jgi:hypothetical protein
MCPVHSGSWRNEEATADPVRTRQGELIGCCEMSLRAAVQGRPEREKDSMIMEISFNYNGIRAIVPNLVPVLNEKNYPLEKSPESD